MTGAGVEGLEAEVVEDEEIGAAEGFDEARMAAVSSGERQVLVELRPAMIENRADCRGRLSGRWRRPASFCRRRPARRARDCRGRRSIRLSRASGTARGRGLGRRDSRRPRRSPADAIWRRAAGPSGVCPSAVTSPCRGAGRASRRAADPLRGRRRRDRRKPGHSIKAERVKPIEGWMFEHVSVSWW